MKPTLLAISFIFSLLILILFILTSQESSKHFINDKIVAATKFRYNNLPEWSRNFNFMPKPPRVLIQYLLPQHTLSHFAGWLAENQWPFLKNNLIRYYLYRFNVDMKESVIEDPYAYPSFNTFFTRNLKPECRPIVQGKNEVASPVDGFVSQIGRINRDTLIQAKGRDFNLNDLLGDAKLAQLFLEGSFATFYLSPKDYHRVHMPYDGKLRETLFIPGKLFSVDQETTSNISGLFAKNERLVCIFDTSLGPLALIFVGAMIVSSINTVWHTDTTRNGVKKEFFAGSVQLKRGEEAGYFKMGSTVILLFGKDKVTWNQNLKEGSAVKMGELIAVSSS